MGSLRVVGLISGTSVDAIDVAVADLRLSAETVELAPVGHTEVPYPDELREEFLKALPPNDCSAETLCRLDTGIGQAFAGAAAQAGPADLVASLGQTIYHWVDGGRCLGTLQLGQPAWIAERTGLPVVADLRTRDVAAGGHGAPLAGLFDQLWLTDDIALNIGGIANISVVSRKIGAERTAYDTGPGNALIDLAAEMVTGEPIDRDGELALAGTVRPDLLTVLRADPYYGLRPPKSTGKEHFHAAYLHEALARVPAVDGKDLLATLVELTATTIADACNSHQAGRVVASGGGIRNPALRNALARHLTAGLVTSDELGIPGDAKEAYLTALLGFLTWHGIPANPPTGATGPRLLGSITPGREPLRLPGPATTTVTRLQVVTTLGGARAST